MNEPLTQQAALAAALGLYPQDPEFRLERAAAILAALPPGWELTADGPDPDVNTDDGTDPLEEALRWRTRTYQGADENHPSTGKGPPTPAEVRAWLAERGWRLTVEPPLTVERLARALDDHLPRMAFERYGQFYADDPFFDVEAYYARVAAAILGTLEETP